jgi:hypothetical protein
MTSEIQKTLLESLASVLTPLARLMLLAGIGYREFDSIAKRVFVQVASKEYGLRGRPTNMSRISAMTGISRKQVGRLRDSPEDSVWSQTTVLSPAALVIHYWHHDVDYIAAPGQPRPLRFQGPLSFSTLVTRYAGDVPPGAVRAELFRAGTIREDGNGLLVPCRRFFLAARLDESLVRSVCFSLSNLANTVVHNVRVTHDQRFSDDPNRELLYLERSAFTDHISADAAIEFRNWVKREGVRFLDAADAELGEREIPREAWTRSNEKLVGVGLYYYQTDRQF